MGRGSVVGQAILDHKRIDAITFPGRLQPAGASATRSLMAARAVFGLLHCIRFSVDEQPREDNSAGMAAWAWFMACPPCSSTALFPRRTQEGWRTRFSSKGPDPNTKPPPSVDGHHVYTQCLNLPVVTRGAGSDAAI
jgi:hypothetical protein